MNRRSLLTSAASLFALAVGWKPAAAVAKPSQWNGLQYANIDAAKKSARGEFCFALPVGHEPDLSFAVNFYRGLEMTGRIVRMEATPILTSEYATVIRRVYHFEYGRK